MAEEPSDSLQQIHRGVIEVRDLMEWARENKFPISRVKIGPVEVDLVAGMTVALDNPTETEQDTPETGLTDPDGPVTNDILHYSSGYKTPEE